MYEIIDLLSSLDENDILSLFKMKKGYYVKISKNQEIRNEDILKWNKDKEEVIEDEDIYNYFRERSFYDGAVLSNLVPVQSSIKNISGKVILSTTPYKITITMTSKNTLNLKDRETNREFFKEYFQCLSKFYGCEINMDDYLSVIVDSLYTINEILGEKAIQSQGQLNLILDDFSLNDQKTFYEKYCEKRCFLGEKINIDGTDYVYPCVSNSINEADKPSLVLSNNVRNYPIILPIDKAKRLTYIMKISDRDMIKLLEENNPGVCYEFSIDRQKTSLQKLTSFIEESTKYPYYNFTLIQENEVSDIPKKENKDKTEVRKIIDSYTFGMLSQSLRVDASDKNSINSYLGRCSALNRTVLNRILNNQKDFKNYFFYKGQGKYIIKELFGIFTDIFDSNFYDTNFCKRNKLREMYDALISILCYLDNNKEMYKDMAIDLKNIQLKLKDFIVGEKANYSVESDEEFLYTSGQVLNYLVKQSKAANKGVLLKPFSELRNINMVKDKIKYGYERYGYDISLNSRMATVIQELYSYKLGEKIKLRDKGLWFYYNAGLIGQNLFYTKRETAKSEPISN